MRWDVVLSLIFIIFVVVLLVFYWFVPLGTISYGMGSPGHSNFSLNTLDSKDMQFYENMRYPNSKISYRIENCPLNKEDEMKQAFQIISNSALITFYPVSSDEEISVTCDSKAKVEGGLFIAGEGGPSNITQSDLFNVIHRGTILLIRESKCSRPNIGIHELLHALGFDHSSNPNNIMYNISRCSQTIGQDTIDLLNWLYSFPSLPDLTLENVSAIMRGAYLDVNMTVRNNGLKNSEKTIISIYAENKLATEVELDVLEIGHGRMIILNNVFIMKRNVDKLEFFIDYDFEELDKDNNEVTLEIKK
jgi:hypothetical protein